MAEALVVQESQPLRAADIRAQVNLIQEVMKAVMIGPTKENPTGTHYGLVPGCGDKPTLLKPGAEKLMMTFRLAADPQVEEVPTDDGLTFRVVCRILNQATGVFLGAGVGECSTKEEKYNWRKAVCDGEFNETPEDRRRNKWVKGYGEKSDYKIKQIRTNPADVANTVLKMAKKRALVDAILTVTAASDIFTQDIEDMPKEDLDTKSNGSNGASKGAPPKQPQSKSSGSAASTSTTPKDPGKTISEGQKRLIFAKSKAKGISEDDIKAAFCVASITDITMGQVNDVIAFIDNGVLPGGSADPEDCTHNPETCPHSSFNAEEDMKPYCLGERACPYQAK